MYTYTQIQVANIYLIDSSQCCTKLQIVSSGLAGRARTETMGTYEHYTSYKDNNVYKHIGEERFLHWSIYDFWMVC